MLSFQSPSNRVKCSERGRGAADVGVDRGFNPLVIGSSVLIFYLFYKKPLDNRFQSPSNRVKCSDDGQDGLSRLSPRSFNPLVIGSSVLMLENQDVRVELLGGFNPLVIGSSVLIPPF